MNTTLTYEFRSEQKKNDFGKRYLVLSVEQWDNEGFFITREDCAIPLEELANELYPYLMAHIIEEPT
jgi:hypothetical protein